MVKASFKDKEKFYSRRVFNLRNILTQRYYEAELGIVLKCGHLGNRIRSNLKVCICGAVEGWRRSVGPIM